MTYIHVQDVTEKVNDNNKFDLILIEARRARKMQIDKKEKLIKKNNDTTHLFPFL